MVVGGARGYLLIFRLPRVALSSINKIRLCNLPFICLMADNEIRNQVNRWMSAIMVVWMSYSLNKNICIEKVVKV